MKLFVVITSLTCLLFLSHAVLAQVGPQTNPNQSPDQSTDDSTESDEYSMPNFPPNAMVPFGYPQARPQKRRGAQRLGEWVCRDEPPPPGNVITRGGSMGSCVGTCASRYIEPLRDHMVICAGQEVPEGYNLLGVTTVPDCNCISDTENALIIQLKPGYRIKRTGAMRDYTLPQAEDSYDSTDITGGD